MHYSPTDRKPLQASHIIRDLRELLCRGGVFRSGACVDSDQPGFGPGSSLVTKYLIDEVVAKKRLDALLPLAGVVALAIAVQAVTSYASCSAHECARPAVDRRYEDPHSAPYLVACRSLFLIRTRLECWFRA